MADLSLILLENSSFNKKVNPNDDKIITDNDANTSNLTKVELTYTPKNPKINENDFFAMRGILGQYVIVVPERNIIVVRLGKKNLEKNNDRPKDFDVYLTEALKMFDSATFDYE